MSSMPILSSQTPNNSKIASNASGKNAPTADDISNGTAPFGELLAKQLNPQGHDIKRDILKAMALVNGDPLAADPNTLAGQSTDAMILPADLLAGLLPQDKRAALSDLKGITTESAAKAIPGLSEKADDRDPSARRTAASIDSDNEPDTRLAGNAKNRTDGAQDKRGNRGITADSAFAAALQAEKKTGLREVIGKIDNVILPGTPANTTTAIGMPGALAATPAAQVAATQATISTPLNQPQWAEDFSQKVTWVATQRSQSAELHLNPAQLGPLEVSLKLNGDQATMQFTSAHAAVREAIEQSIPRLRDMLADSGISLGNTTVSDQAPREQQQREQSGRMNGNSNADNSLEADTVLMQATTRLSRHDGVVDTFV